MLLRTYKQIKLSFNVYTNTFCPKSVERLQTCSVQNRKSHSVTSVTFVGYQKNGIEIDSFESFYVPIGYFWWLAKYATIFDQNFPYVCVHVKPPKNYLLYVYMYTSTYKELPAYYTHKMINETIEIPFYERIFSTFIMSACL